MNGIGNRLRRARNARGIELAEVEERLKIRVRYVSAIEDERWDLLPGDASARGFLRTYGDFLGLDGAALVEEYRRLDGPQPAEPDATQVHQIPTRKQRPGLRPPRRAPGRVSYRLGAVVATAIAALLGIILVLGLTRGGEEENGGPAEITEPGTAASPTQASGATTETPAAPPPRVTLRLTATGTVWVCLVDDEGSPVIQGVTLPAGDEQGPFRARAFEVTFGNGAVQMKANGDRIPIPPAAEPLGYRLTPEKTTELPEASRPTCT
jgi:cytoskeleton protein RodZ